MRKLIIILLCCLAMVLLFGCTRKYKEVDNFLSNLSANNISMIEVNLNPEEMSSDDFIIKNQDDIKKIVDFFKALDTSKTKENPNQYGGSGYDIRFQFKDGDIIDVILFGNLFIMINGHTKELVYEEAIAFENLIGNIMINHYQNDYKDKVLNGEITYISKLSEENEFEQICMINTSDKNINIGNSLIVNMTGSGEGLKLGDKVLIYYKKSDNKNIIAPITAEKIFIILEK